MIIDLALVSRCALDDELLWWADVESDYVNVEFSPVSYAQFLVQSVAGGPFSAHARNSEHAFGASTQVSEGDLFLAHSGRCAESVWKNLDKRVLGMIQLFSDPANNRKYLVEMNDKLSAKCLKAGRLDLCEILYEAERDSEHVDEDISYLSLERVASLRKKLEDIEEIDKLGF